jgi:hypothetical protein
MRAPFFRLDLDKDLDFQKVRSSHKTVARHDEICKFGQYFNHRDVFAARVDKDDSMASLTHSERVCAIMSLSGVLQAQNDT